MSFMQWEAEAVEACLKAGMTPESLELSPVDAMRIGGIGTVRNQFGHTIATYDDGPSLDKAQVYISRNSIGINGIVRAGSWEQAYSICEDQFFPPADLTPTEMIAEYGEDYTENGCWQESYGFRPNGASTEFEEDNGIYSKDLNGEYLDVLTEELWAALKFSVSWKAE